AFRRSWRRTSSIHSSPPRRPGADSACTSRSASPATMAAPFAHGAGRMAGPSSRSISPPSPSSAMSAPAEPRRRGLLPPLPPETAGAVLPPPPRPATARRAVAPAGGAAPPRPPARPEPRPAAGRTLLARALHAAAGRTGPLVAAEGRCRALHDLPAGASVLIDLAQVTVPATAVLEALLDDGAAWLLVGTLPGSEIPAALAARLAAVTVRLPPLPHPRPHTP